MSNAADTQTTSRGTKTKGGRAKSAKRFGGYQEALQFALGRVNIEKMRPGRVDTSVFKLDRMRAILKALGDPTQGMLSVHIAGTNGKGSVVAMVEACLEACGYATGTFTSPHLIDMRERVAIGGQPISHVRFTRIMGEIADACDTLPKNAGEPTYFEIMTALGAMHFAEQCVDVSIYEVGLGGRLDTTNAIEHAVSAVTQIDLDHTHLLGSTIEEIAREKGGIFRAGAHALTFRQEEPALSILRACAEEAGVELGVVGDDIDFSYRFESSPQLGAHTRVGLNTERMSFEHLPAPMPGEHQARNTGLALAIADRLTLCGLDLHETPIFEGIAKTRHPGRMEVMRTSPRILLDGAHNPAAMSALVKTIGPHVPYDSMVMIFGCSEDKDIDGLLDQVALGGDKVIFTQAKGSPRARTQPICSSDSTSSRRRWRRCARA